MNEPGNQSARPTRLGPAILRDESVMVFAGALLFSLLSQPHWIPVVTPDSTAYLSAADHLLRGDGFVLYDGSPMVLWPPLYAIYCIPDVLLHRTGFATFFLNHILYALLVVAITGWLRRQSVTRWIRLIVVVLLVTGYPLRMIYQAVWSESLYTLLSWLALTWLMAWRERALLRSLIVAALLAAAAAMTRYIGVTVIATGALTVLLAEGGARRLRWGHATLYGALASLPLGIWLLRNTLLTGTIAGARPPASEGALTHLMRAMETVSAWFVPREIPFVLRVVLLAGAIITLIVLYRRWCRPGHNLPPVLPLAFYPVLYMGMLVASASRVHFDRLNDRMLAPLFPVLIALAVLLADRLWHTVPMRIPAAKLRYGLVAIALVGLAYIPARGILRPPFVAPYGYYSERWRTSWTMRSLERIPTAATLVSNRPDAIYFQTGRDAVSSPRITKGTVSEQLMRIQRPAFLVWFEHAARPNLHGFEALRPYLPDRPEYAFGGDGAIYRLQ